MGKRKKAKPKLRIWLYRNEPTGKVINAWLKDFDLDADGGLGMVTYTDDRDEAMVFDTIEDVHEFWTQQSTLMPLRPDGQPNRPLTAFTVEVRPVEEYPAEKWGGNISRGEAQGNGHGG